MFAVRQHRGSLPIVLGGLLLLSAASASAQASLSGRVTDPLGEGIGGLEVLLHRVDSAGGAQAGVDVTRADGRFTIELASAFEPTAIYFATARSGEELFIGPPFRGNAPPSADYGLTIEPGRGARIGEASALLSDTDAASRPAGILAATGLVALIVVLAWRRRTAQPPAWRLTLAELAALDEYAERGGADPQSLSARRIELRSRLARAVDPESHAAAQR